MKKTFRHLIHGSAVAFLSSSALQAAPFISIADTVDVFFLGSISADYRTNLFNASAVKNDDFVFTFSPGLEARIGRDSNATVSLIFKEDILVYHRFHGQNTQLANVILNGSYNTGPLELDGLFSFRQTQTNTPDTFVAGVATNRFVERDQYNAEVLAKYDISPKFWTRGAVKWGRTDYTNNQDFNNSFSNQDAYSLPLNVFYRYTEKLSLGLGYRYRYTDVSANSVSGSRHYNDHFISLAVTGELAPKLEATANVGYQYRDTQGNSHGQFALDARLDYNMTEKVNIFAGGGHDFGVSSTGNGKTMLNGYIGADYRFTDFISSTVRFERVHTSYDNTASGRKDDTTYANIFLNYSPNVYWTFSAGYGYSNNGSSVSAASYSSNTFSLSASLRY